MAMLSRITELFEIDYPVISGGMVWCSGWELAAAVSNAGGLGLIGSGSMTPEVLREHIIKCREATAYNFGVNVPLMRPQAAELMEVIAEQKVPIVFTSAGSPKKWTSWLHERGIKVAHVVSSATFAAKCEAAGVDAVVAEGFERRATRLPLIAAGGIVTGDAMLAAEAMGADGVQLGTLFALTQESSAHENFKRLCLNLDEGSTMLHFRKLSPTRLVKNNFQNAVQEAENRGATEEELLEIIGIGKTRTGIFEGDVENGELEIGQAASLLKGQDIETVDVVMNRFVREYYSARKQLINQAMEEQISRRTLM